MNKYDSFLKPKKNSSGRLTFLLLYFEKEPVYKYRYLYRFDDIIESPQQLCEWAVELQERINADKPYDITERGFKYVTNKQREIITGIIEKYNDIQDIVVSGKTFPELLEFQGISLWQFITGVVYAGPPQDIIELIEYLTCLINESRPVGISVIGNVFKPQKNTIELVGRHFDIPVYFHSINKDFKKFIENKIHFLKKAVLNSLPEGIKANINKMLCKYPAVKDFDDGIESGDRFSIRDYALGKENKGFKDNVLLVSFPRVWAKGKGGAEIDQYYEAFKTYFRENNVEGVRLETPYYFQIKGSNKAYIDSVKDGRGGFSTIFFDEYYSNALREEAGEYRDRFKRLFANFRNDKVFLDMFSWKGISFFTPLIEYWEYYFTDFLVDECIASMLISRKIIADMNPRAVFVLYEVGQYSRALIIESHRARIPSFGLQHGMIFKEHEYYLHKNQSVSIDFQKGFYGFVAPQKTLVFGRYSKDVLTKEGYYPESSVVEVGEWRFTNSDLGEIKQRALAFKYEWFIGEKKIALLLTSILVKEIINTMIQKLNPEKYAILIKLHPDDHNGLYYEEIFRRNNFDVRITKDYLYESIMAADIVFTSLTTTVVLDCLVFEKPTFCCKYATGATIPWDDAVFDIEMYDDFETEALCRPVAENRRLLSDLGIDITMTEQEFTDKLHRACLF